MLLQFLSLKVRVASRFTAETRGYLKCEISSPAYMNGWTYARTIFSEPKFLGCIDSQIFLPLGAPLRVLRYHDKNIQYFESKQQMRYP